MIVDLAIFLVMNCYELLIIKDFFIFFKFLKKTDIPNLWIGICSCLEAVLKF
jgi:hypothetical protein